MSSKRIKRIAQIIARPALNIVNKNAAMRTAGNLAEIAAPESTLTIASATNPIRKLIRFDSTFATKKRSGFTRIFRKSSNPFEIDSAP